MAKFFITILLFFTLVSSVCLAQNTYCNPMDIDYKYNFEQIPQNISYRSGADPCICKS